MFCLSSFSSYQGKFAAAPTVLITANHISSAFKHDAASLWVENATSSSFFICLRELQNYDGLHEDIFVVYFVCLYIAYIYMLDLNWVNISPYRVINIFFLW